MARILFGVAGEGFGHSSRSELIGRRLMESGNEVLFAASAKSLAYLKPLFPGRVEEVHGLGFVVKDGQVLPIPTLMDNIVKYHKGFLTNRRLFSRKVKQFAPDLVISDFEPFCAWWADRHRIPCVFIDNEHVLTMAKLEDVPGWLDRVHAKAVTRGYHTRAKAYVIMNFFTAPLKTKKAVFGNPVIRKQVLDLNVQNQPHITVYSTDSRPETKEKYISIFQQFAAHPFYIYGFGIEEEHGNCHFKKTSTEGFLKDLASGSGVVATAGLSLLSECLYLKKRMFLMPLKGQFEQQVNAVYAQHLGFARCAQDLNKADLKLYLADLDKAYPDDGRILWPDNEAYFGILDQTLQKIGFQTNLISSRDERI
jgi:uncharacterized protein (TIGR00661 family)